MKYNQQKMIGLILFLFVLPRPNLGACNVASVSKVSGTHATVGPHCAGDILFEDNFDTFNLETWHHENTLGGGGNWEFQWYANNRSNSYVENGILKIKPTLLADEAGEDFIYNGQLDINGGFPTDECTNAAFYGCSRSGGNGNLINPIKSARIRSVYSFSYLYGRLEVRAKLPAGDWIWPAIWLMPRYNAYSTWPSSGEIDVVESRGNKDYANTSNIQIGSQLVSSTLHWGPSVGTNQYPHTHWETLNGAGWDSDFHTYAFEWTPDRVSFSVDDVEYGSYSPPAGGFWEEAGGALANLDNPWKFGTKMAPFDQKFYIIINLAVGGTAFFPDDCTNPGGKPWPNDSPNAFKDFWEGRDQWLPTWNLGTDQSALQIDYIRVTAV